MHDAFPSGYMRCPHFSALDKAFTNAGIARLYLAKGASIAYTAVKRPQMEAMDWRH
jgi:hypothetical protein